MAKYWASGWGDMDMSSADFSDFIKARGVTVNDTTLRMYHGGGDVTTFKGDFDLNKKGFAVGGTITKFEFGTGDYDGTFLTGIKVDLNTFIKVARTNGHTDDAALFAKIFSGDDTITGGFGEEVLKGFDGNDTLIGGDDADQMTGGLGADIFAYKNDLDSEERASDTITDFSQADGDKISLRGVGFFDFDTEIRVTHTSSQTIVEVDTMGGFNFPLFIRLDGTVALTEADFLL